MDKIEKILYAFISILTIVVAFIIAGYIFFRDADIGTAIVLILLVSYMVIMVIYRGIIYIRDDENHIRDIIKLAREVEFYKKYDQLYYGDSPLVTIMRTITDWSKSTMPNRSLDDERW